MGAFLKCEFFTLVKLLGLVIVVNLIVKIIGDTVYLKILLVGSFIAIGAYILLFVWKFTQLLLMKNSSEYQCKQGDSLKRAFSWLSNIV